MRSGRARRQRCSATRSILEWTYRIAQEPRRLLPRYVYYNPRFLGAFSRQLARERRRALSA